MVFDLDSLPLLLAHEARLTSALLLVELDQLLAELRLEHAWQNQNGSTNLCHRMLVHGRQAVEYLAELSIMLLCIERKVGIHPHEGIEH